MRRAEEIAKRYKNFIVAATEEEVVRIIKQIQIEAIDETVKLCAKNAKSITNLHPRLGHVTIVDEQSILQVADNLKKELE